MAISTDKIWLCVGFFGQFLFSLRFLWQWIYSEKHKKSVIPIEFWYFSLLGGGTLLAYALYKQDPVFVVGQAFGFIVYFRNLILIFKEKKTQASA